MKQITAEDVRLLQKETGEGIMSCKKILVERYKAEEKLNMTRAVEDIKWQLKYFSDREIIENIVDVLDYLVRRS